MSQVQVLGTINYTKLAVQPVSGSARSWCALLSLFVVRHDADMLTEQRKSRRTWCKTWAVWSGMSWSTRASLVSRACFTSAKYHPT